MTHEKRKPLIFAVVLHYMNDENTSLCINTLLNSGYESLTLVVVDNASPNKSLEILKAKFPDLTFLQTQHNIGNAGGLNVGIRFALSRDADFILLSDNDVFYTENFLPPLIKSLTDNPDAGIASPKILYNHDKNKIYCAGGKLSYLRCVGVSENRGRISSQYAKEDKQITFAEGCCMLVKKEVFHNAGLLEEKFFMYYEDFEFSERAGKKYKIIYNHDSVVYHKCGAGLSWTQYSPLYFYFNTRNRFLVFEDKHFSYLLYVTFYSTLNLIAKSSVLFYSYLFNGYKTENRCIRSLWSGYIDGIKMIFIKTGNND